ncbi:MAG TPA: SRPBCC domain-containing protein, partial [bacterium]|nr:SRPBCC domain-containing protein [bacterium]
NQYELRISRTFDVPRDLMFRVWTEAEHLGKWWGPKGIPLQVHSLDVRPGGHFHYTMHLPNGDIWWGLFLYEEVAAPERLIFTSSFSDPDRNLTRPPFSPTFPLRLRNTYTFTEADGRTTVALHAVPVDATPEEREAFAGMQSSMHQGYNGTLDQLAEYLTTLT